MANYLSQVTNNTSYGVGYLQQLANFSFNQEKHLYDVIGLNYSSPEAVLLELKNAATFKIYQENLRKGLYGTDATGQEWQFIQYLYDSRIRDAIAAEESSQTQEKVKQIADYSADIISGIIGIDEEVLKVEWYRFVEETINKNFNIIQQTAYEKRKSEDDWRSVRGVCNKIIIEALKKDKYFGKYEGIHERIAKKMTDEMTEALKEQILSVNPEVLNREDILNIMKKKEVPRLSKGLIRSQNLLFSTAEEYAKKIEEFAQTICDSLARYAKIAGTETSNLFKMYQEEVYKVLKTAIGQIGFSGEQGIRKENEKGEVTLGRGGKGSKQVHLTDITISTVKGLVENSTSDQVKIVIRLEGGKDIFKKIFQDASVKKALDSIFNNESISMSNDEIAVEGDIGGHILDEDTKKELTDILAQKQKSYNAFSNNFLQKVSNDYEQVEKFINSINSNSKFTPEQLQFIAEIFKDTLAKVFAEQINENIKKNFLKWWGTEGGGEIAFKDFITSNPDSVKEILVRNSSAHVSGMIGETLFSIFLSKITKGSDVQIMGQSSHGTGEAAVDTTVNLSSLKSNSKDIDNDISATLTNIKRLGFQIKNYPGTTGKSTTLYGFDIRLAADGMKRYIEDSALNTLQNLFFNFTGDSYDSPIFKTSAVWPKMSQEEVAMELDNNKVIESLNILNNHISYFMRFDEANLKDTEINEQNNFYIINFQFIPTSAIFLLLKEQLVEINEKGRGFFYFSTPLAKTEKKKQENTSGLYGPITTKNYTESLLKSSKRIQWNYAQTSSSLSNTNRTKAQKINNLVAAYKDDLLLNFTGIKINFKEKLGQVLDNAVKN